MPLKGDDTVQFNSGVVDFFLFFDHFGRQNKLKQIQFPGNFSFDTEKLS